MRSRKNSSSADLPKKRVQGVTRSRSPELLHVLVREPIADDGIRLLKERRFQVDVDGDSDLAEIIGNYHAIIIRSATRLGADLLDRADRLEVIGRAGIGIDNVDVAAATARGILVANAPSSAIEAAAEHTFGLLLAVARNIPQAHVALKEGRWERTKYSGVELAGKTLGILGFGRIGREVARRAIAFGMRVVAYDPQVLDDRFKELAVVRVGHPGDVVEVADFLTLHASLTEETKNLLDRKTLEKARPNLRIVNAARGALIDHAALWDVLNTGKIAGAALDVFDVEPYTGPLLDLENVVVTPHLAASTRESQERVGVAIAREVAAALEGAGVTSAVNFHPISDEARDVQEPFLPVGARLGQLARELTHGRVESVSFEYEGAIGEYDTAPLTDAGLNGLFLRDAGRPVSHANARAIADEWGIPIRELNDAAHDFTNLVRIHVCTRTTEVVVAGTTLGTDHRPLLVEALGFQIEIELQPLMAFIRHSDAPGMIGHIGTVLGEAGVNIGTMAVSRTERGGETLTALSMDTAPHSEVETRFEEIPGINKAWFIELT